MIKNVVIEQIMPNTYLLLWEVQNSITKISTFNEGTPEVTAGENRSSQHGVCQISFIQYL